MRRLLAPTGRLLNHAVSTAGGSKFGKRSFVYPYVFLLGMQRAGCEVRDVESLREHYALTLCAWVANLQRRWDEAVALVGEARARIWLLYMAGSAVGFDDAGMNVHQVLGVVHDDGGGSGMPAVPDGWATRARPPSPLLAPIIHEMTPTGRLGLSSGW